MPGLAITHLPKEQGRVVVGAVSSVGIDSVDVTLEGGGGRLSGVAVAEQVSWDLLTAGKRVVVLWDREEPVVVGTVDVPRYYAHRSDAVRDETEPEIDFETSKLSVPTGLTVQAGVLVSWMVTFVYADLSWNAVTDAVGYSVKWWQDNTAGYHELETTGVTTRIIGGLLSGYKYYFQVAARRGNTVTAYCSPVSSVMPGDTIGPNPVVGLTYDWTGPNLELKWGAPEPDDDLKDYRLLVYDSSSKVTLYRTAYLLAEQFTWTLEMNRADTGGPVASCYVEVYARDQSLNPSSVVGLACANSLPPAPVVSWRWEGPDLEITVQEESGLDLSHIKVTIPT